MVIVITKSKFSCLQFQLLFAAVWGAEIFYNLTMNT